MNAFEFIASLTGSLAWPLATLALVLIVKTPLRHLLTALTSLKYKDLQLDFGRELRRLEAEVQKVITPGRTEDHAPKASEKRDALHTLSEADRLREDLPEAAVALAWSAVEDELLSAVMRLRISPDYPPDNSARKNARLLADAGVIPRETVSVLDRMRNLRNLAVRGESARLGPGPVSSDEAREFVALARSLVNELRSARLQTR